MPLDPQIATLLAAKPQLARHALPIAELRAALLTQLPPKCPPVASAEDRIIPSAEGGVTVRIYRPEGKAAGCLVYFHGGGFVMGSPDTHDQICRELCAGAQTVIVAADYRLAPEHPFPCGLNDCEAVLRWAAEHSGELDVDPAKIMVGGDSAGGNLATVLAIRMRDKDGPYLHGQVLLYPVTDAPLPYKPSYIENAVGYSLTRDDMLRFWRDYAGDGLAANNSELYPLRAQSLAGLPASIVITAGFDPLRDEGRDYAQRLMDAGVPTTLEQYDGAIHGFVRLGPQLALAKDALQQVSLWMTDRFRRPGQTRPRGQGS